MENRLTITNIQLDSVLSDGVGFMWDEDAATVPYGSGWWLDSSTRINDISPTNKKDKIVKLVKKSDWSLLDLDWKEKVEVKTEILFKPEVDK
jgi:hypothetical protein